MHPSQICADYDLSILYIFIYFNLIVFNDISVFRK